METETNEVKKHIYFQAVYPYNNPQRARRSYFKVTHKEFQRLAMKRGLAEVWIWGNEKTIAL